MAGTRLGIPVTVSTDPRHGVFSSPLTGQTLEALSRWPEHTGMAALPEAERRVQEYGDVVRREYLALGFRVALGPMADIYSDPRWSRGYETFGEDPGTVARLTAAFIRRRMSPVDHQLSASECLMRQRPTHHGRAPRCSP
ncbi:glycoside hydrolase family 3 N-terminal domain-containing protein [Streptomyces sp. MH13]|uniref:glycoside hydrolase family 3 N-terminal domain-containing protein n=1 Tax=Streptomyces sp. MH13 TaxID=3417651 RepID=UPI003CF5B651